MKKRFLSATLAAILAASSLSVAAFADDDPLATGALTDVPTTGDTAGTATVTLAGTAKLPAIKVKLPASIGFVLNPYKLSVVTDETTSPKTTDNNLVLSKPIEVENKGESKIAVNVKAVPGAAVEGSGVVINNTGVIDTKTAELKSAKQVAIWVEPATQKHVTSVFNADGTKKDGTGITTYTFANKYNAKTCALATTYTAPELIESVTVSTEYSALGDAYTKTGKTIAASAWSFTGTGAEKLNALATLLFNNGALVKVDDTTYSNINEFKAAATTEGWSASTAITTDIQKKKAVGVEPVEITLFTLAPGDEALIAKESNIKNAPDDYNYPALDTNKGQFKISGILNQNIDGNWTDADKVNVTLTFNIKLLSN